MLGVILAGGTGSRLRPLTHVTNKHLLPVYNKPMIAYPLQYLLNAGITDIFVVTGGEHFAAIAQLLGSGKKTCETLGIQGTITSLAYGVQDGPGGIAEALGLAKRSAGNEPVVVVLGDNIFEDPFFLCEAVKQFTHGGHIFLKEVSSDQLFETAKDGTTRAKFGVAEVIAGKVLSIEEKPKLPKSNYAVSGAYIYDNHVFSIIPTLTPSARGELEITDVNNFYLSQGTLRATTISGWWSDAGTITSLYRASTLLAPKHP